MISDDTFNSKYFDVVNIFRDWMPKRFDFPRSSILDFGCEHGIMSLSFAERLRAKRVVGVDINGLHTNLIEDVGKRAGVEKIPPNLEFYRIKAADKLSKVFRFDVGFAWSTMEHVSQVLLDDVVSDLFDAIADGGYFFVQIAPLYYSPLGSHLEALLKEPWAHLSTQTDLFRQSVFGVKKETTIFASEADPEFDDIRSSMWSCYETLNKMTADQLVDLFERHGFVTQKQVRTTTAFEPSLSLLRAYSREALQTEQIVVLFRKPPIGQRDHGAVSDGRIVSGGREAYSGRSADSLVTRTRAIVNEINRRRIASLLRYGAKGDFKTIGRGVKNLLKAQNHQRRPST